MESKYLQHTAFHIMESGGRFTDQDKREALEYLFMHERWKVIDDQRNRFKQHMSPQAQMAFEQEYNQFMVYFSEYNFPKILRHVYKCKNLKKHFDQKQFKEDWQKIWSTPTVNVENG